MPGGTKSGKNRRKSGARGGVQTLQSQRSRQSRQKKSLQNRQNPQPPKPQISAKNCPHWQHMDRAKSKTMYCACLQETGHVRTCGVERTYQRRRTLSPLSLDAARAAELGLSYGQYKAREVV